MDRADDSSTIPLWGIRERPRGLIDRQRNRAEEGRLQRCVLQAPQSKDDGKEPTTMRKHCAAMHVCVNGCPVRSLLLAAVQQPL